MGAGRIVLALAVGLAVALPLGGAVASPEAMKALGVLEMRQPTLAPDVTMPTLSGAVVAMKDLRGQVVLVNFWATWCTPCQWEMPLMEALYQAYQDRGFVGLARTS
jgi:thiol-disulfide isomerase/thioredoxin